MKAPKWNPATSIFRQTCRSYTPRFHMHYPPNATWVLFVNEIVYFRPSCGDTQLNVEAATTPNPNPMLPKLIRMQSSVLAVLALLLLGGYTPLIAQVDITGSITDGATGEPLIGATVIQKEPRTAPTPVSMVRSR